jgi:hypothetical protein
MSKAKGLLSVFFLMALASMIILSACQSAKAAESAAGGFDQQRTADYMTLRWQGKASAYERLMQSSLGLDPDDVASQRWNAMAASYEQLLAHDIQISPNEAMVQRWQAMGRFYEKNGLFAGDAALTAVTQE